MAEHAIPLVAALADVFVLWFLVAARDASRVALGGMHLGSPALELSRLAGLFLRAVIRSARCSFAVRVHRSSIQSKLAFTDAYHLSTG